MMILDAPPAPAALVVQCSACGMIQWTRPVNTPKVVR